MLDKKSLNRLLISALLAVVLVCASCAADDDDDDDAVDGDSDDDSGDDDSGDDDADDDDDDQLYVGTGYPFSPGELAVSRLDLSAGDSGAPADLTVYYPTQPGQYAVVQFQHGFLMSKDFYSDVLQHLSSHGFIVVAPQMYEPGGLPIGKPTSIEEAALAGQVAAWAFENLDALLGMNARTDHFGLAGHSRGGKVGWILLKGNPTLVSAVAGIDPVDSNIPLMGEHRVCDGPFAFPYPSLVIGTGLGSVPLNLLYPACAPEGDNHEQFYEYSASPAYHSVTTDYGHLDMLNDETPNCGIQCDVCSVGPERQGMRILTGGLLTAFFRATLQGDESAYLFLTDPLQAPGNVELEWK